MKQKVLKKNYSELIVGLKEQGGLVDFLKDLIDTLNRPEEAVAEVMGITREKLRRFLGKKFTINTPDIPNESFIKLLNHVKPRRATSEKIQWHLSACLKCRQPFLWQEPFFSARKSNRKIALQVKTMLCWRHSRSPELQNHRIKKRVKTPTTVDRWAELELAKLWDRIHTGQTQKPQKTFELLNPSKIEVFDETLTPPRGRNIDIQIMKVTIPPKKNRFETLGAIFKTLKENEKSRCSLNEIIFVNSEMVIPGPDGVDYYVFSLLRES